MTNDEINAIHQSVIDDAIKTGSTWTVHDFARAILQAATRDAPKVDISRIEFEKLMLIGMKWILGNPDNDSHPSYRNYFDLITRAIASRGSAIAASAPKGDGND